MDEMTTADLSTLAIAIISLVSSFYVIWKDRKNRMYELLYRSYERIQDAFTSEPISESENEHGRVSQRNVDSKVSRELEVACYFVYKNQIAMSAFFDLFARYLAGRWWMWSESQEYNTKNNFYTWHVIQICVKKKYLPINKNKRLQGLINRKGDVKAPKFDWKGPNKIGEPGTR